MVTEYDRKVPFFYCDVLNAVSGEVHVPLWVKKGTLRFPEEDTPVIMVGPGTGVAPFRSALQERIAQGKRGKSFYFCDLVPSPKSIYNSTVTNTFLSLLLFRQRSVLRLSLGVQRLLLQVGVGREDEGRTADPLHCLLTGPGHKDTFILSFVLFILLKCDRKIRS